jgi:hypothetical protein
MRNRSFCTSVTRSPLVVALAIGALVPATAVARTLAVRPLLSVESPATTETVHATRGVVKAISATTLVVSRFRNRGDIAFTLSPALHLEGTLEVGATISVRYRDEGNDHVATAISVQKHHHE